MRAAVSSEYPQRPPDNACVCSTLDETFSTRLDDKRIGRQIVIEQRTHAADLTGHLLAEQGWYHIALPAIAERKAIIVFPRSRQQHVRMKDDILWPVREGNLIKREWLTATYHALPARFDSLVLSLGTVYKTAATNDYSAAVVIGTASLHKK